MNKERFGYSEHIPEEIREIFIWFCEEVASFQSKWDFYTELFGKEENTELLSDVANYSFRIIEESLRTDMTMTIGRLCDPPKDAKNKNLSFEFLVEQCPEIVGLKDLMSQFQIACKPIKVIRNKRTAHNDLNSILSPNENPIPGIGKRQVEVILDSASRLLNAILHHYENAEMSFHLVTSSGGKKLIMYLQAGQEYIEKNRRARFNPDA